MCLIYCLRGLCTANAVSLADFHTLCWMVEKKHITYVIQILKKVFLWSATWLDRCDTSSCWVPGCLETEISAAVGLLVQADPHLTVVLLETRRHRWVEVNFKSTNVGWLPFALEMLVRVGLLWQGSLPLVIYGCWINANLLLYFSYYTTPNELMH